MLLRKKKAQKYRLTINNFVNILTHNIFNRPGRARAFGNLVPLPYLVFLSDLFPKSLNLLVFVNVS